MKEENEKTDECQKCGDPVNGTIHECPYECEINDNCSEYCNCCDECTQECLDDT